VILLIDVNTEYVDIDDALKRVGGNLDLYKRLLGRFVDSDQLTDLEDAIRSEDQEHIRRAAHTLKGVSANLSLGKIRLLSLDIELAIKNGLDYSAIMTELREAYDETVKIISEIVT